MVIGVGKKEGSSLGTFRWTIGLFFLPLTRRIKRIFGSQDDKSANHGSCPGPPQKFR